MCKAYSGGVVVSLENLLEDIEELEVLQEDRLNDEEIVIGLWNKLIDNGANKKSPPSEQEWITAIKKLSENVGIELSVEYAKKQFVRYFKERFGVEPFVTYPVCGKGITRPRKNIYNQYFIGCGEFPVCRYMATRDDRDLIRNELNKLKDSIIQKAEGKISEVNALLAMVSRIGDNTCSYDDIRKIKKEMVKYD